MEDVPDLEFGVLWRVGSSPTSRTNIWFHRSSVRMMACHAIEAGSTPSLPTISPRSLMDRQRISNPSYAGSSPAGEATELIFIKKYYIIYM